MPKMSSLGAPPSTETKTVEMTKFKGVDLTSSVTNVAPFRSPAAPNMMPNDEGFPTKRTGFHTVLTVNGKIYGAYALLKNGVTHQLLHAGTKLYKITEIGGVESAAELYGAMNEKNSAAQQLGGKLWILDGKKYLVYDGMSAKPVEEIATVPKITIAKAPNGKNGATSYLPVNLLTGKRTDSYLGTATDKDYFLSFNDLSASAITVQQLDAAGNWKEKTDGFTVNRTIGKVSFAVEPGKSPLDGEDNVRITYETNKNGAEKINKCTFSILYGVNGQLDRLFVSGNALEQNVDRWSEWNDPCYFGDISYGAIGQDGSAIVGYSVLNEKLVAHKAGEENGRNAFMRTGSLDKDGNALFTTIGVVQAESAVSVRTMQTLNSEPVYLCERGIVALAAADVTGERYAQNRSYYLNGSITKEKELAQACAVIFGRFYVLATGNRLYLLDAEQKTYEAKMPASSYQYEGYYWTGIDACCLWVQNGKLRFGTASGNVREFYVSGGTVSDYMDDEKAVSAYWTTPLLNLNTWSNLKTVTGVWVVGQPYNRSGAEIYYATDKEYEKQVRSFNIDILDWNDVDFNRWTFNTMDRPVVVNARKKAKKVKLFQVKIQNYRKNEPFGIFAVQINYKIGGKVKR